MWLIFCRFLCIHKCLCHRRGRPECRQSAASHWFDICPFISYYGSKINLLMYLGNIFVHFVKLKFVGDISTVLNGMLLLETLHL